MCSRRINKPRQLPRLFLPWVTPSASAAHTGMGTVAVGVLMMCVWWFQARSVFHTWDKNHNGRIERKELDRAMHAGRLECPLDAYSGPSMRIVSPRYLQCPLAAVVESMKSISAQTGGHATVTVGITKDQICAFVEDIFEQADDNHDGDLDEDEFVKVYNTIAINCIDYNESF